MVSGILWHFRMNLIHKVHPVRSVHPICAWYHKAHDGQPFLRDSGWGGRLFFKTGATGNRNRRARREIRQTVKQALSAAYARQN
jgi:hypothetical protein